MTDQQPQTPWVIPWAAVTASLSFLAGSGLTVGAVFILCGAGWALLAGATLSFLLSAVIYRGLR